jgi:hypothetical protein
VPKSGFCSIGHHEGGRYPGPSGKMNKTCTIIEHCTCDDPTCHPFFNRMFEESGLPRQPVDNSGYEPEHLGFVMPEPVIVAAPPILSVSAPRDTPGTLESVAPGLVPPRNRRSYGPTETGRAARGQLEDQVNEICSTWVVEQYKMACTPQYIAEEIARKEGIKAPSTGAIAACFDRWEKIGYATIGRKPTRFISYTEEAVEHGLGWIKEKAKRGEETRKAAVRRGERV